MSLWKRGKWFWADFSVNGVRYRVPLKDTKGRKISADEEHGEMAARAEEREIQKADRGELVPQKRSSGRLPFTKAADEYLASRRMELAPSSLVKEIDLSAKLKEYFGVKRLSAIKAKDLLAFRERRNADGVGPALSIWKSAVCAESSRKQGCGTSSATASNPCVNLRRSDGH
jgi:hypothetical protein